jgi:5-aminopentanamidase
VTKPTIVTVLEVPARFDDVEGQLKWIVERLSRKAPGEIVVLPEACLTGYVSATGDFNLSRFAEPLQGHQFELLRSIATQCDTTVVGPVIERDGVHCFNSTVVIRPDGTVSAHYRKRHPWMPETWATAGTLPFPRFDVGELKCSLAVCFDVHFLAEEAADVLREIDVLLFPSAWVDDSGDARPGQLTSLAQQFDITIVNANWGVGSPHLKGQGGSMIIASSGRLLARTTSSQTRLDVRLD